jgi:hypothetical protein
VTVSQSLLTAYLAGCGDSPFSLSVEGEEPEPAGGVTPPGEVDEAEDEEEVDPDDEEVDIDSDDEDPDAEDEDMLNALGGAKKPTRRDLKDPNHGAKYRTLIRTVKGVRRQVRVREDELTAKERAHLEAVAKLEADKASFARDMQGRFTKAAAAKADPKPAEGAGKPGAAGKGAQAAAGEPAKSALPQSEAELDALIAKRMAAMFGSVADADAEATKAQQAEAAKKAGETATAEHNAWINERYKKEPTKEHAALLTRANKEVFGTVFDDFQGEFVANRAWYSEFCVELARLPDGDEMQAVYNLFAKVPHTGLLKRKPAEVIRDLTDMGRRLGVINTVPAAPGQTPPDQRRHRAGCADPCRGWQPRDTPRWRSPD